VKNKGVLVFQTLAIMLSGYLDYLTTVIGLRNGAHEVNGLMRHVIDNYGNDGFLYTKLGFGVIFSVGLRRRPVAALVMVLITLAVVANNLRVLDRLLT
jgi:hypothetical protein